MSKTYTSKITFEVSLTAESYVEAQTRLEAEAKRLVDLRDQDRRIRNVPCDANLESYHVDETTPMEAPVVKPTLSKEKFVQWLNEDPKRLEAARKRACESDIEANAGDTDILSDMLWNGCPGWLDATSEYVAETLDMALGAFEDFYVVRKQLEEDLAAPIS